MDLIFYKYFSSISEKNKIWPLPITGIQNCDWNQCQDHSHTVDFFRSLENKNDLRLKHIYKRIQSVPPIPREDVLSLNKCRFLPLAVRNRWKTLQLPEELRWKIPNDFFLSNNHRTCLVNVCIPLFVPELIIDSHF